MLNEHDAPVIVAPARCIDTRGNQIRGKNTKACVHGLTPCRHEIGAIITEARVAGHGGPHAVLPRRPW